MATHLISRRIQNLIQFIYDYKFPSKENIIEFLNDRDFKLSSRTLERDLERIRADFGLEIEYSKKERGYFINEEKSIRVDSFFKLLEIITVADIFTESLRDSNKILDYVSFDDSKSFKGIENVRNILIAIEKDLKIIFEHENYYYKTTKEYEISPLLLKEYENRWYIIGVTNTNQIRTFGLDRISDLQSGVKITIHKNDYLDKLKKFNDVVGVHYGEEEPIKVSILVDELHVKYMRSLPLHHSQIIHPIKDGNHQVDFYLIPNYEFKTQILKIGVEAEVIKPMWLRNEIKEMLIKTLKKYN